MKTETKLNVDALMREWREALNHDRPNTFCSIPNAELAAFLDEIDRLHKLVGPEPTENKNLDLPDAVASVAANLGRIADAIEIRLARCTASG